MIRSLSPAGVRFGVVTDIHFPTAPDARQTAAAALQACVDRCNAESVDLVVQLGDLIEQGYTTFDAPLEILAGLDCDLVHVLGNHDFDVADERLADVPSRLGLRSRYYAFSQGNVRFVILDGNDISLHAHPPGSRPRRMAESMLAWLIKQAAPEGEPWNGALTRNQAEWLDRQLREADQAGEAAAILNHFPVWPRSRFALWNGVEILDILTRHRSVALYVNGHAHEAAQVDHQGIRFVTAPALAIPANQTPLTLVEMGEGGIDVQFLSLQVGPGSDP
jgi:predicted phosphodiesterase